jgi:short-subunit dehydrogenase
MRKILVCGAASGIAEALGRRLAAEGCALALAGRNAERLAAMRGDLALRGAAAVHTYALDLRKTGCHAELIETAAAAMEGLDTLVLAHGILGDQEKAVADFAVARDVLETNFLSSVSLLTVAANRFAAQQSGQIVVFGSVAGDRGRQSNYVYGASKGALEIFCQGLRNRLAKRQVNILLVKPGFVDTAMTAHLPKNALFASPERVAADIHRAMRQRKDVIYTPGFWKWVMLAVRLIPEPVFKRMRL